MACVGHGVGTCVGVCSSGGRWYRVLVCSALPKWAHSILQAYLWNSVPRAHLQMRSLRLREVEGPDKATSDPQADPKPQADPGTDAGLPDHLCCHPGPAAIAPILNSFLCLPTSPCLHHHHLLKVYQTCQWQLWSPQCICFLGLSAVWPWTVTWPLCALSSLAACRE